MNKVFHSCGYFIRRKTAINCLLKAGEQHSEMNKNLVASFYRVGCLQGIQRTFVFGKRTSTKDP